MNTGVNKPLTMWSTLQVHPDFRVVDQSKSISPATLTATLLVLLLHLSPNNSRCPTISLQLPYSLTLGSPSPPESE
jgi:hypothetical protein